MVFNSLVFLVFLAITLLAYYRLGYHGQNRLLLIASYVFYGWWDYRFLALLLFSTFFDYWCALWIEKEQNPSRRRTFLAFSMIVNMSFLGVFKYFNFFADGLQRVLAVFGMQADLPTLQVILPVGISFYTFLSMSYTIDVYRGQMKATHDPLNFMLYVAFFPHLVAGPIVRASYLLPQCERPRVIRANEVVNGIWLILLGYVKKVVIADRLAPVVNWGFASASPPFSGANNWLIIYAFAFQIYGDFAGYSDIARGLAKLMGFELTINFRAPYFVTNPPDFWKHWHITLSTWLRDYLYIPLGGNRHGPWKTYRNLMTTMLLGGLWHGAGAAYVLWGLYHGLLLAWHRGWSELFHRATRKETGSTISKQNRKWNQGKRVFWLVLFFHVTCIGWLVFRAGSAPAGVDQVQIVSHYLATLTRFWPLSRPDPLAWGVLLLGSACLVFQWKHEQMDHFSHWATRWQVMGVLGAFLAITVLGVFEGAQFIYFQF